MAISARAGLTERGDLGDVEVEGLMKNLEESEIIRIMEAAVAVGLEKQRTALLAGPLTAHAPSLDTTSVPAAQLLLDLSAMNGVQHLDDDDRTRPIEAWLTRAVVLAGLRTEARVLREMLDKVRRRAVLVPSAPPHHPHGSPPPPSRAHVSLVDVRSAYRIVHAYHRRLFDLLEQVSSAIARDIAPLPRSYWGSYYWDDVPKETAGFLDHWVYDFVPLQHAYFGWSSSKSPQSGSFYVEIFHSGDSAVDEDPRVAEPDSRTLPPVKDSKTTLAARVLAIGDMSKRVSIDSWTEVEEFAERSPGYKKADWLDENVHRIELENLGVRYGGFKLDMMGLDKPDDIQRELVVPLIALVRAARR